MILSIDRVRACVRPRFLEHRKTKLQMSIRNLGLHPKIEHNKVSGTSLVNVSLEMTTIIVISTRYQYFCRFFRYVCQDLYM